VFLTAPLALVGLVLLSLSSTAAALLLTASLFGALLGLLAIRWPEGRPMPWVVAVCGFVLVTHTAGLVAWGKALRGERNPIWEPTRRVT
jgi:hypothetical protein